MNVGTIIVPYFMDEEVEAWKGEETASYPES